MAVLSRVYHGTVNVWLPLIKRDGLHYVADNKWKTELIFDNQLDYNPSTGDPEGYVYLADLDTAKDYAKAKALYLRTQPCKKVPQHIWDFDMVKDCDAPVIADASPVILSIPIRAIDRAKLSYDPGSRYGIRYHGVIDPNVIEVIKAR